MANKYEKVEWEDRQSQYPNRRKLVATEIENVYEVERAEGEVTEPGNAFDATNMNGLEDRVYSAFDTLDSSDIQVLDKGNHFVATELDGVLSELFTSASNGKSAIATAIGSPASSSDTFGQLASKITAGKGQIASAIGSGSSSDTFSKLAELIKGLNTSITSLNNQINSGKTQIVNAIGNTRNGPASAAESFEQLANRIKNDKTSFYMGQVFVPGGRWPEKTCFKQKINVSFGFKPTQIFLFRIPLDFTTFSLSEALMYNPIQESVPDGRWSRGIDEITETGFTIWVTVASGPGGSMSSCTPQIFAYA